MTILCHFGRIIPNTSHQLGRVIPNIHVTLHHFPIALDISSHFGHCHKRPCFLLVLPTEEGASVHIRSTTIINDNNNKAQDVDGRHHTKYEDDILLRGDGNTAIAFKKHANTIATDNVDHALVTLTWRVPYNHTHNGCKALAISHIKRMVISILIN